MLSKVYEWLRAADLEPDDGMVRTRTKVVEDLEKRIRDAKNYTLLLGTVTAAVGGCERLGEQSSTFGTLLECVRAQQPAFPGSLSENSLHLRMLCCLALGELLSSEEDEADEDELMAASLLVAGLGLKPKEAERHLDDVFDELAHVAHANLQEQAVALRERQALDWAEFKALEGVTGDAPTFNQKLLPAVRGLIEGLEREHRSDREELEVMWWLYNGYSDRLGKQLKPTTLLLAATAIGCEIADRVAPPATVGLNELVAQAAVRDRTAAQIKAKSIDKIVAELGDAGRKLLLPGAEHVRKFARSTGPLLPLTWLCVRLEESQGASGWEAELQSKTGLTADRELAPNELAAQVFAERQAQRVYQTHVKGSA
jgi:hypothetical protein